MHDVLSSSGGCKALVASDGGGIVADESADVVEADAAVGPEAVAAYLAGGGCLDAAQLDHGLGELIEEGALVAGEGGDEAGRALVAGEALVGEQHPLGAPQRDEVPVVEGVGRDHVQALLPGAAGGAVGGEPPGEVVVPSDEAAAGLPHGVAAGERDEVGGVGEAPAAEGAEERVHVGEGRREGVYLGVRGRPEAVGAALGHRDGRASGQADGVAGGERDDVGAGDGGAAHGVHLGADALDQLQRPRLQRSVGTKGLLAVQKDGRVAPLVLFVFVTYMHIQKRFSFVSL